MSKIPYIFDLPPPKYFRDNGWFTNPNMVVFIHWAFARCGLEKRNVYHVQKSIELEPFEFIFGRRICSEETGLTEREIRTCIEQLSDQQKHPSHDVLLKKTTSKTTNKFTVYKWSVDVFCKVNNQQNDQQTTSRRPADDHNQEEKKTRSKKRSHPSIPSFVKTDGQTDDFSFENKIFDIEVLVAEQADQEKKHNINYHDVNKTEIVPRIFLTKKELDDCLAIKGSLEVVKDSINYILKSPKRKHEIKDWVNALATWTIKTKIKVDIQKNQKIGEYLEKTYSKRFGWCCEIYKNKTKGDFGILFFNNCGTGSDGDGQEPLQISFSDGRFEEKIMKILIDKGMKKVAIA